MRALGQFGNFDGPFCDALASWVGSRRVLEVFGGNGLLASMLAARSVDIVATSLFAEHDGHKLGMHHHVLEFGAVAAVEKFGSECDVLLMSWPTTVEATTKSALIWGDRPIVFIGEVSDHSLGFAGLSGCATDSFFAATEEIMVFEEYVPVNRLDRASVRILRPSA